MGKIIKILDVILDVSAVLAMVSMTLVLGMQIFFRYVLNNALSWVFPFSLFLFIWMIWLGGTGGIRDETQIRIDFAERLLPFRIKRFLMPVMSTMCILFLIILVYKSIEIVRLQLLAPYHNLPFSRGLLFIVVPIMGSVMVFQYLRVLIRQIKKYY